MAAILWRLLCRIGLHPWRRIVNDRTGSHIYRCRGCAVAGMSPYSREVR